jgi:secreted Zn-dependent insulinase-like peptidase
MYYHVMLCCVRAHRAAAQWSNAPLLAELKLPGPNPFIPRDLTVKNGKTRTPKAGDATVAPRILKETDKWLVNFREDDIFGQVCITILYIVISVIIGATAVAAIHIIAASTDQWCVFEAIVASFSENALLLCV